MAIKSSAAGPVPAASIEKLISGYEDQVDQAVATGSRLIEQATAFAKGNVEAAFASTRIAVNGIDAIAQDAGRLPFGKWQDMSAFWAGMPDARSPAEFLKAQTEQASAALEQMVSAGSRFGEAMFKLGFDVAQPITKRCAAAMTDMPTWLEQ